MAFTALNIGSTYDDPAAENLRDGGVKINAYFTELYATLYGGNTGNTSTAAIQVPVGTVAQRPTGANGKVRYNSDGNRLEAYENAAWRSYARVAGDTFTGPVISPAGTAAAVGVGVGVGTVGLFNTGNNLGVSVPQGESVRFYQATGSAMVNRVEMSGHATGNFPIIRVEGTDANIGMLIQAKASAIRFDSGSGLQQFRVNHTASAVNYVAVTGAVTTGWPRIEAAGTDANIGLQLMAKGTGIVGLYSNGTRFLQGTNAASVVNYFQMQGAVTTGGPVLSVQGTDGNIGMFLDSKGTGSIRLRAGGIEQFRVSVVTSAVNYLEVFGSVAASASGPNIRAQGSDTNVPLSIDTKGSGVLWLRNGGTVGAAVVASGATVNYLELSGSLTGVAPIIRATGTDTDISMRMRVKGLGAYMFQTNDGVNDSHYILHRSAPAGYTFSIAGSSTNAQAAMFGHGGPVMNTQMLTPGSNYTAIATATFEAPGGVGVTATGTVNMRLVTIAVNNGGTGYTVGDVLTLVGGTATTYAQVTVSTVNAGVITAVTISTPGSYQALVAFGSTLTCTGGTGTGAIFNASRYGVNSVTIVNGGSLYTRPPVITITGGQAAGGGVPVQGTVQSFIGGSEGLQVSTGRGPLDLMTNSGIVLRAAGLGTGPTSNYFEMQPSDGSSDVRLIARSDAADVGMDFLVKGAGAFYFYGGSYSQKMATVGWVNSIPGPNFLSIRGAAAGTAVQMFANSDTEAGVALALSSRGSSNVSIYTNSGTVEALRVVPGTSVTNAITVQGGNSTSAAQLSLTGAIAELVIINAGAGYTSIPAITISAPPNTSGTQAVVVATMNVSGATVAAGGTGYTVGDVLTVVGGTRTVAATLTVATVSSGVITGVTVSNVGASYSVLPTNPVSVTGGTGTGATFTLGYKLHGFTYTNRGTGYVSTALPTVTLAAAPGGGTTATAYAHVGFGLIIHTSKSLTFKTTNGDALTLNDVTDSDASFALTAGRNSLNGLGASDSVISVNSRIRMDAEETITLRAASLGTSTQRNVLVAKSNANAVNYIQLDNASAGNTPSFFALGTDSAINIGIAPKGSGYVYLNANRSHFGLNNNDFSVYGRNTFASGRFTANGDSQSSYMVARRTTTDGNILYATTNNATHAADNILFIPDNSAIVVKVLVVCREAATGDMAAWEGTVVARRGSGVASTALIAQSFTKLGGSAGSATWAVTGAVSTASGGVIIGVTGEAAHNIKWTVTQISSEVVG